MTNRELFFDMRKHRVSEYLTDSMLYEMLIHVNELNSFTDLIINFDKECKDENMAQNLFSRANNDEPLEYLFNKHEYNGMKFYVDKNVLIPRPETEELIQETIGVVRANKLPRENIIDVCTGSGIIAISLKKEFSESDVYGSDISSQAINIAIKNAEDNGLNVNFLIGNILEPVKSLNKKFDILVSNPPYVEKIEDIAENVKKFEPLNAIYVENGTYFYEEIFKNYKDIMKDKFLMAFEINYDQEDKLTDLIYKYFDENNSMYRFQKDSFGRTRFLFILGGYESDDIS